MLIEIPDDFRLIDLIKIAASKGLSLKSARIHGESGMRMVKESSNGVSASTSGAVRPDSDLSGGAVLGVQPTQPRDLHLRQERATHAGRVVALSDAPRLRALGAATERTPPTI